MDQRDRLSEPGRCQRCRAPGDAAPNDDHIVMARIERLLRKPAQRPAPGAAGGVDSLGGRRLVPPEEDRVAAAVEAGEIVQHQCPVAARKPHLACRLPRPVLAIGAEHRVEFDPIDRQREPPWMMRGDPVLGADPHPVFARRLNGDHRACIDNGPAEAMRQQVGGAHLRFELGIDDPTAGVVEVLRFDEDPLRYAARAPCPAHSGTSVDRPRAIEAAISASASGYPRRGLQPSARIRSVG